MRSIVRLLQKSIRKTTLTAQHMTWMLLAFVAFIGVLWWTHPHGILWSTLMFIVAGGWAVFIEPRWVQRREYEHRIQQNIENSIKLAVVGDLHIGSPYATLDKLQELLRAIVEEQPDVLVLVGDYVIQGVIGGKHVHISKVVELIDAVDVPTVAIIGNHDVKDGRDEIHAAFEGSTVQFLENEHCTLTINGENITFVGLDDESTGYPTPSVAFPEQNTSEITVCLAHDPATFLRTMPYQSDLCLAGHTHAGQVRIPGIGALVLPGKSPLSWSYGWVKTDNGPLYVTSGFGTSIAPIRFCAPPEYVFINLVSGC